MGTPGRVRFGKRMGGGGQGELRRESNHVNVKPNRRITLNLLIKIKDQNKIFKR